MTSDREPSGDFRITATWGVPYPPTLPNLEERALAAEGAFDDAAADAALWREIADRAAEHVADLRAALDALTEERDRLAARLATAEQLQRTAEDDWTEFGNAIVENAPDDYDGDDSLYAIAIRYVRDLESERDRLAQQLADATQTIRDKYQWALTAIENGYQPSRRYYAERDVLRDLLDAIGAAGVPVDPDPKPNDAAVGGEETEP